MDNKPVVKLDLKAAQVGLEKARAEAHRILLEKGRIQREYKLEMAAWERRRAAARDAVLKAAAAVRRAGGLRVSVEAELAESDRMQRLLSSRDFQVEVSAAKEHLAEAQAHGDAQTIERARSALAAIESRRGC